MKALKVLVILMGVAIVGGFAVIAFTLAGRMSGERQAHLVLVFLPQAAGTLDIGEQERHRRHGRQS